MVVIPWDPCIVYESNLRSFSPMPNERSEDLGSR